MRAMRPSVRPKGEVIRLRAGRWPALVPSLLMLVACHSEPTFVITFAPQDGGATVARSATRDAALAPQPDAALAAEIRTPAKAAHECKSARDCVLVSADCCGCSAGGRQISIAKSKLAGFKKAQAHCGAVSCVAMLSADPSCTMVADCLEERCVLANAPAKKAK
jgi:hypothetical protein